jgi:hypothetical protein
LGTYYIVAKAFRGEGRGTYSLSLSCSGPCSGEQPEELDAFDRSVCIGAARNLTVREITLDAALDPAAVFYGQLEHLNAREDEPEPTCATACSGESQAFCDEIVDSLRSFSGLGSTCYEGAKECQSFCEQYASDLGLVEEVFTADTGPESICWLGSEGEGGCANFARDLKACGGSEEYEDASGQCEGACFSSAEAWDMAEDGDVGEYCQGACE